MHQVQLGLLVSQADYAIVLCYKTNAGMRVSFDERCVTERRVDADAQWQATFLSKAGLFYAEYLEWLFAPTPDVEKASKRLQFYSESR